MEEKYKLMAAGRKLKSLLKEQTQICNRMHKLYYAGAIGYNELLENFKAHYRLEELYLVMIEQARK